MLDPESVLGAGEISGVERLEGLVERAAAAGVTRAVAILPEGPVVIDIEERVVRRALDASEEVVGGIDGVLRPVDAPEASVPYPQSWPSEAEYR